MNKWHMETDVWSNVQFFTSSFFLSLHHFVISYRAFAAYNLLASCVCLVGNDQSDASSMFNVSNILCWVTEHLPRYIPIVWLHCHTWVDGLFVHSLRGISIWTKLSGRTVCPCILWSKYFKPEWTDCLSMPVILPNLHFQVWTDSSSMSAKMVGHFELGYTVILDELNIGQNNRLQMSLVHNKHGRNNRASKWREFSSGNGEAALIKE